MFVHGLCETDEAWNGIPARPARHVPYGHRMEIELGYSPLYLRYNTGRHVSENGREFAGHARTTDRGVAGTAWTRSC